MPNDTSFLIFDTESVPDGNLVAAVKYPGEALKPDEAVDRARAEAIEHSWNNSDFLPYTFQIPVAVCVLRVDRDFSLQAARCLDAPEYRPKEIAKTFWKGLDHYKNPCLVTFNGRCFDLPLLELTAFRHGFPIKTHLEQCRHRYKSGLDLQDFFTNYGASRFAGGLNLAAKMLGLPGKMDVNGQAVLEMHRAGKLREINDYCLTDTLDTYFVFLRTRVMCEEISSAREKELIEKARVFLLEQAAEWPVIGKYFEAWDAKRNP